MGSPFITLEAKGTDQDALPAKAHNGSILVVASFFEALRVPVVDVTDIRQSREWAIFVAQAAGNDHREVEAKVDGPYRAGFVHGVKPEVAEVLR